MTPKIKAITMGKQLVTMDAPADYVLEGAEKTPNRTILIDEILSTGFNADNLDSALNPADAGRVRFTFPRVPSLKVPLAERMSFAQARTFASLAAYRIGVIEGDLVRHLQSVQDEILIRTTEQQAALSIVDIDKAIAELQKARDALSGAVGAVD